MDRRSRTSSWYGDEAPGPRSRSSSWYEEAERFRDLDEIREEPRGSLRTPVRWLLVGILAGLGGLVGWHALQSGGADGLPSLGKFDQLLARHTPQRSATAREPSHPAPQAEPAAEPQPPQAEPAAPAAEPPAADDSSPQELGPDELIGDVIDDAESPLPKQPGGYHIQVASLRSKQRAELLVGKLKRDGHNAAREAVGLRGNGWWHTVRIGPFDTRIDAEIYRLQFDPFQGRNTVVVPRSNGEFHVQVASLRSREKAVELAEGLKQRGHHARRRMVTVRGRGEWHTVRIGPFDTRAEAEAYRTHFVKLEEKTAVVVPFELLKD